MSWYEIFSTKTADNNPEEQNGRNQNKELNYEKHAFIKNKNNCKKGWWLRNI